MLEVMRGKKPNRPPLGFSDSLWNLLLKVWEPEYGPQPPKRPPIQPILDQLKQDANDWDRSVILPPPPQAEEETRV